MELTKASRRLPMRAKGGNSAVTITAATFLTLMSAGLTVTPIFSSIEETDCRVKMASSLSPEPARPTIRP